VAVSARAWAQKNPDAFERGPLTVDDVLKARMVASPLTVRDCCLVTDGAGAFVLQRADAAKAGPQKPAYVLGTATACWNRQISSMPDLTVTAASQSGAGAFAMAGLTPQDVQIAELYDAFTINTLLFLEDLGFVAKGEGGRLRRERRHRPRRQPAGQHQRRRPELHPPRHVRHLRADRGRAAAARRGR
jgi:acetyl-CoA acetyltransferase